MPLSAGERLGPYEILASLGEGGMGQVFRARDTRLHREVAIKVSAEQFTERFAREAQLIASLNHPNICTLHDVGPNYLVMELIEGPTLHDRIAQGPMPAAEAIPLAIQIAEALEAAHDKGIIHRDLKPANIKLTADGKVKVLDFGLAKALESDEPPPSQANSPTLAPTRIAGTQAGFILGTAGYMAPEQARGHAVDRRADIFAFGIVLWEMTTGRRMFDCETISDTLAQVLTQQPEIETAPVSLRPLLMRCLEKDRRKRLQAIGEARIALESPAKPPPTIAAKQPGAWPTLAAALAVALLACAFALYKATRTVEKPLVTLDVDLGTPLPMTFTAGSSVILSPDGTRIAYLDDSRKLFTRRLDETKATLLTASPVQGPFFSPDGRWIGYYSESKLFKILATGGTPIALCPIPTNDLARGATWLEDGTIVASLASDTGLVRIPESGGTPQALTTLDPARKEVTHRFPHALPGSKAILFSASASEPNLNEASIDVLNLSTGQRKSLRQGGYSPRYLDSGLLVYVDKGTLYAIPFHPGKLELMGSPTPVLDGLLVQSNIGYTHFDAARDGTAVYRRGRGGVSTLHWIDTSGKLSPPVLAEDGILNHRLSPDDKRIVYTKAGSVWVYEIASGNTRRMTFENSSSPLFTPRGDFIVYNNGSRVACIRADGAGTPQVIAKENYIPMSFSPEGQHLILATGVGGLFVAALEWSPSGFTANNVKPLFPEDKSANTAHFSPDGRWIAYRSSATGNREVFVRAWPDTGAKYQISTSPGGNPVWSKDRKEIFWVSLQGQVMATSYSTQGNAFVVGKTRTATDALVNFARPWPVTPAAGNRLLAAISGTSNEPETKVVFLFHFFDELKRRLSQAGVKAE